MYSQSSESLFVFVEQLIDPFLILAGSRIIYTIVDGVFNSELINESWIHSYLIDVVNQLDYLL